jgi:hypothetical protein
MQRRAGTARDHQFFGEELHEAKEILPGRRIEPQFRFELQRTIERMAEMCRAVPLHYVALEAHAYLGIAGMPAHVQRQRRRHERSRLARRFKPRVAASDRGKARHRNLDQKKIIEPLGIDFHFGAVFEPIDRRTALTQVVHARRKLRAGAVQAQQMRLEYPRHAEPDGIEIARRKDERVGGKCVVGQLPTIRTQTTRMRTTHIHGFFHAGRNRGCKTS